MSCSDSGLNCYVRNCGKMAFYKPPGRGAPNRQCRPIKTCRNYRNWFISGFVTRGAVIGRIGDACCEGQETFSSRIVIGVKSNPV